MSYSTQPAFVHFGSWDDETRKHPAMKWMEDYTNDIIDGRVWEKGDSGEKYHTPDWSLGTSDGRLVKGANEAWAELAKIYGPFKAQRHDPEFLVAFDTDDGWRMIGVAQVYFSVGGPGNIVQDPRGDSWDGVGPGAFQFHYVKDGDDIKLKETKIFSDPSPVLKFLLQAGALNGDQIAGMLKGA